MIALTLYWLFLWSGSVGTSTPSHINLKEALTNNQILLELYRRHLPPDISERYALQRATKTRVNLFRRTIEEVVRINDQSLTYSAEVNFFAYLSEAERSHYLGLNVSEIFYNREEDYYYELVPANTPDQVNWVTAGHVTYVSDQGMCGSCWAFAGVGALETRYSMATGTLKKFSEQESLDCVYDKKDKDGCRGGQYFHQFEWMKEHQHQATAKDYPYKGRIFACRKNWFPNAMTHAEVFGQRRPPQTNDGLAGAIALGSVAVGLKVSPELNVYKTGIFRKEDCGTPANHAVTAVGYSSTYFLLKNSWGSRWGDHGFVKFDRTVENMCDIALWGGFPDMIRTKEEPDLVISEECRDRRSDCKSREAECGTGINWLLLARGCRRTCGLCGCRNAMTGCAEWAEEGFCSKPNYNQYMSLYCPLSCGLCKGIQPDFKEEDETCSDTLESRQCLSYEKQKYCTRYPKFMRDRCSKTCGLCDQCPEGTVFCDGTCQHIHMCSR